MNWICIETDGMPNDRGYALPVRCFVCNPETLWAGVAQCDRSGWYDVHPPMDPRDGDITHYCEIGYELPQDLNVKWPRDWGKVCVFGKVANNQRITYLVGVTTEPSLAYMSSGSPSHWLHCRLATPEEAGDMKPLTVPEEVRG